MSYKIYLSRYKHGTNTNKDCIVTKTYLHKYKADIGNWHYMLYVIMPIIWRKSIAYNMFFETQSIIQLITISQQAG